MGRYRISSARVYRGMSYADRKAERIEYRRREAAVINIRKIFKANCGLGAVYLNSEMQQRGEYNTVAVQFEMVPEGRKFTLDGVIHEGDADAELERAVVKIATIAKNIREHVA